MAPGAHETASGLQQFPVRFESQGNKIAGMLTLPDPDSKLSAPLPAVAFVAGSGSSNRHGSGLYPPIFEEFASHGIASFSWDKPGVGESTGDFMLQSFEDRAEEVVDAINAVRNRDDIDSDCIGMWGISQAGWIMPQVCSQLRDIAFMIAVSVPVSTVNEQNVFRIQQSFPADGFSEQQTARAVELVRRLADLALADATVDDAVAALTEFDGEPWLEAAIGDPKNRSGFDFFKSIATFDVQPFLREITCPVLGIFGDRDRLVNVDESIAGYRSLLAEAGNDDVTLRVLPNSNHSIALAETGGQLEMARMAESGERVFAPGYIELMGEWLSARVAQSQ